MPEMMIIQDVPEEYLEYLETTSLSVTETILVEILLLLREEIGSIEKDIKNGIIAPHVTSFSYKGLPKGYIEDHIPASKDSL